MNDAERKAFELVSAAGVARDARTRPALERRIAELYRQLAAASELLPALKIMVREWIEIVGDEDENSTPGDVLEKAKAAIAKAEGEPRV